MRLLISVPIGRATFEEMDNAAEWRAAIQDGVLRRDTLVTVYRDDEPGVAISAGSVGELGDLFDELLGAAPTKGTKSRKTNEDESTGNAIAPVADSSPPAAAVPSEAPAAPGPEPEPGQELESEPEPVRPDADKPEPAKTNQAAIQPATDGKAATASTAPTPSQASAPPNAAAAAAPAKGEETAVRPQKSLTEKLVSSPIAWTILIIILLLMAISTCTSGTDPEEPTRSPGEVASMYVGRVINVRDEPSRSSATLGSLRRGEHLEGVWRLSEGETWFEITSGSHAGRFVWGGNLVPQSPPQIAGEPSVEAVLQPAHMLAEPRSGARIMTQLFEGQSIDVLGWTSDGWAEVAIERLGIGYVPAAAFQPAPEDQPAEAEEPEPAEPEDCRTVRQTRDGAVFEQEYCRVDGTWAAVGRAVLVRQAPAPPPQTGARTPRPGTPSQPQQPTPRQPGVQPPVPTPPRPTAPAVISRPVWTRRPDSNDFNRVMPEAALDAGQQGSVGLSCRVTSTGHLENCTTTSETPEGWGFARAAMRISSRFRMAARDEDGLATAGRTVSFSITFAFEDE